VSELLRRFRYPLTYLVLASLSVIGLASRPGPAEIGLAPRLILEITAPLERMVVLPVAAARSLWKDYLALVGVRHRNQRLREELARLREENLQYREAILASERFQRLADFRSAREVPMVPANVVAHDISPWFRSIVIDQGERSGIRPGMPVITDQGVVGLVAGTTPGASKVLLVTDPQSRVDAFVQRTRARGTVRGRSVADCEFEYVLRDEEIRPGDLLVTSGLDSVYPKGLVVGSVGKTEREPYGLFQRARIEPSVDFGTLEEVFVLLDRKEVPSDAAFEASVAQLWSGGEQRDSNGAPGAPATD
jgi:rod shape-determining protein MreC